MSEPKPKSFAISKWAVWEAYLRVKANKGAPGVDEQSIAEFERNLKGNLYKLWNRLSSGSYFPPPVRAVRIPKRGGSGVRTLGVPTVADRIAQTVVAMSLEPLVEPHFHSGSYGYRPGRSALDAVAVCRERCWQEDWVLDLDIRSFFDSVPWEPILKAVAHHTDECWIILYVQRWLEAPLQSEDGSLSERDRGTPQGSAISPLLANMFLHYAFDAWMASWASASSATATTSLSTPQANAKPALCWPRSPGAWRNAGWSSTSKRPASCTARTMSDPAPTSTSRSRSWGMSSAPGWRGASPAGSSSAFSPRSVTTSASASGGRSAAGACTVARTGPSLTSPTRST